MKFFTAILACACLAFAPIQAGTVDDVALLKKASAQNAVNVLRVASAVQDGQTVTCGPVTYEVDTTTISGVTAGNIRVDLHGGSTVAALGTLTSNNTIVNDGDTVTIGTEVYTFKTTLTPTEGQVHIGADADGSLLNLIRAINHTGTPGTDYSNAAADTKVSAAAAVTSHAFVVTALIPGTVGNAIATTETDGSTSRLSWGAATLASGADPTAAEFTTALNTAINATNVLGFRGASTRISASEVLVVWQTPGNYVGACTETLAGANNQWAAAAFYGGKDPTKLTLVNVQDRIVNTTEAALGDAHFYFPFAPTAAVVQITTTAGAVKAYDGAVVMTGNRITVDNSGSSDWAATDVITVTASN